VNTVSANFNNITIQMTKFLSEKTSFSGKPHHRMMQLI